MFSKTKRGPAPSAAAASGPTRSGPSAVPSIIAADMAITGDLRSEGEIHIDGRVDGHVSAKVLVLGETADVRGEMRADSVRICGAFTGTVQAREVALIKTARVKGDIHHDVLSIEAGAKLDGRCTPLSEPVELAGAPNRVALPAAAATEVEAK